MNEADELWALLKEVRRDYKLLAAELEQARHERDEARDVARAFMRYADTDISYECERPRWLSP